MPAFELQVAEVSNGPSPGADEILYKAAENREEREAAFRLVHQAYVRAGLIDPHPSRLRATPHQLQPNSDVFIATLREEVISTVSLIADGPLGLPMEAIYGEEIAARRARGLRLGEASALADRRRKLSRTLPVFVQLMRLMVQSAHRQGIHCLLAAVHPRHARFYQQILSFQMLADERTYPQMRNHPAVALALDFEQLSRERPPNYELFFGRPLPSEQLARRPMPAEDAEYFAAAGALTAESA